MQMNERFFEELTYGHFLVDHSSKTFDQKFLQLYIIAQVKNFKMIISCSFRLQEYKLTTHVNAN